MPESFSWTDIISIAGWPMWMVLACNALMITIIYERLWYLWKPLQWRVRWFRRLVKTGISRGQWERLFFREQRRVHTGLPLIRNLIIICALTGLTGSLINLIQLLQHSGLTPFFTPTMHVYVALHTGLPLAAGAGSTLLGLVALKIYMAGIGKFIERYPGITIRKRRTIAHA